MKSLFRMKRLYLLLLIPLSFMLIAVSRKSSFFAERIYANHIYKWISQILSMITGIIPFSISEFLFIAFPIVILLILIRFIYKLIKDKEQRLFIVTKGIINILCSLALTLFLFVIMGGINYYRYPFSYYADLEIMDSSVDELYKLTESLAHQANDLRKEVPLVDENGVFKLSMSPFKLGKKVNQAMEELGKEYDVLAGWRGRPKPLVLSRAMSYTDTTGIFIPFTMEANVNVHVSDYYIPFTMLHELAHLRGFMREDEANYIAYIAGIKSDNVEIQYSSVMMALVIAGNALYEQDPDLYFAIRQQYSDEILKDLRKNAEYWVRYKDTIISTVSSNVNDQYLKANAQEDGVKSYGRMLDLLLANFRQSKDK